MVQEGGYSPFAVPNALNLEEAVAGVAESAAGASAVNRGPEGRVQAHEFSIRGGEPEGIAGVTVQPCRYAGSACRGCHQAFQLGEMVESRGDGQVHLRDECRRAADADVEERAAAARARHGLPPKYYGLYSDSVGLSGVYTDWEQVAGVMGSVDGGAEHDRCETFDSYPEALSFVTQCTRERASDHEPTRAIRGSLMRRAQLSEKLSAERLQRVRDCIEGRCGEVHDESATACRGGCGAMLHVATCAQMGKGFAALGNFTCHTCRLQQVMASGDAADASEEVVDRVMRTLVLELGQGREATAASYAEYTRLEEKYALGLGQVLDGGRLNLPRHNEESFKNFLTWLAMDEQRARSMETLVRTAGAMFVKLGLRDVTKLGGVKAHMKELLNGMSMESEPATTATPRMLKLIVDKLIDQRFGSSFVASREKLQFVMEAVGGCRIGEVCGGGDSHGLLANNMAILEDPEVEAGEPGKVTVEAWLEHSKTNFSRYLDIAGMTETSKIHCAKITAAYWKEAGFKLKTSVEAGVKVTRPDFWVVRVSLRGLTEVRLLRLFRVLERLKIKSVAENMSVTRADGKRRYYADSAAAQEKKYINVASGSSDDEELGRVRDALAEEGYLANIVPGPLLMAQKKIMPLSTSTASPHVKELLTKAWEELKKDGDPDLDLPADKLPKWSSHSLRRLADTVARRYMEETGTSEAEIDIFFGWHEKVLLKAMQVHYASMSIRERMKKSKITGKL